MKKIYIDVSEMVRLPYISGIQRVVIEVLKEWLQTNPDLVRVITFDYSYKEYRILDAKWLLSAVGNAKRMKHRWMHYTGNKKIEELSEGDVFFDLDSAWISPLKRSWLLPKLKEQGVRVVVNIYDIIPVTHPEYCHEHNVVSFLEYLGAYLTYADLIIANAQATIDAMKVLTEKSGYRMPLTAVVPLGCDFSGKQDVAQDRNAVREKIREIPEKGQYILMVGTIEPRKNHAYVLNAFEQTLFEQGVNLVFAGRIGWNMAEFAERIQSHPKQEKQFYHIPDGSDDEVAYLYENAYAVAFPSLDEGFGLPVIEAFLHGTPVMESDIPVLREVGGDSCVYFDVNDERAFSEQTIRLLSDRKEYQKLKIRVSSYKPFTWAESAYLMGYYVLGR